MVLTYKLFTIAKHEVVGSKPITRSKFTKKSKGFSMVATRQITNPAGHVDAA